MSRPLSSSELAYIRLKGAVNAALSVLREARDAERAERDRKAAQSWT